MDITQIQAAKDAGVATTEVIKMETVQPVPLAPSNERITVTAQRFDPYTGKPVAPEVTTFRKNDLLNDKASLLKQVDSITARIAAIDALLLEFEPKTETL